MKILIIGSGGREHVLADTYSKSKNVKKVYVVPGNDLMNFQNNKIAIFPNVKSIDFSKILKIAKKYKVDLIDVAQDDPLALGFVDKFTKHGFLCFGPTQKASEIEWNKKWSRDFMQKYNLPIPFFKSFDNQKAAIEYIESSMKNTVYVKASGLAAGKGAIRAENKTQAISAIKSMSQFGKSGETFLIEECLEGEEFSVFVLCDGKNYVIAKTAQDHKTVYEKNKGPNTGGMGCVAQTLAASPKILKETETKIIKPFLRGMEKEGRIYSGVLYLGCILTPSTDSGGPSGIKIIEFNARWGDPEAEVILPSIKTDYTDVIMNILKERLDKKKIIFDKKIRVSVAGCSRGYPDDYSNVKGKRIFGIEKAFNLNSISIFGAGIKRKGKNFFAYGGRIFHLVAEGDSVTEARKKAYEAMSLIYVEGNNLHYRTDIGWRDLEREIK